MYNVLSPSPAGQWRPGSGCGGGGGAGQSARTLPTQHTLRYGIIFRIVSSHVLTAFRRE